jgi:hypothetical protein
MKKIFLSFANDDIDFATSLRDSLAHLNFDVWAFDAGLTPGEKWQDAIISRLREVDALVVVVSPASMNSPWIHHEVGAAVAYAAERGKPLIIPVVLGSARLPTSLAQYQGIFSKDNNAEEVALRLVEGLERQSGIQRAKEEEKQETHQQVQNSAAIYIQKSLGELKERETTYRRLAYFWYSLAYFTLLASVGFGVWRALVLNPSTKEWPSLAEVAITGLIVVGLLIALAKYAFSLGKSFMVEALRNADRRHAISFGEFYLQARGAAVDWKEVKEAFQHWNIDKGSNFIGQQATEFDPQVLTLALELARTISKTRKVD